MALIIVESPTKARTFNRILKGQDYYVFATLGHIRDLPTKSISIDYEKDFKPTYEIMKKKQKVVDQLKKLAEKNKEIILATDLDREGESISYHAAYILGFIKEEWPNSEVKKNGVSLKRIVFHEITQNALNEALKNPEELRFNLVKAQQGRRILDRIVGYELSPLLWTKLGKNWLSAGRVQTVALRFVVEREKEIRAFKQETYYQLFGMFKKEIDFRAKLIQKEGVPYEVSTKLKLFAGDYEYIKTTIDKKLLEEIKKDLVGDSFEVEEIKEEMVKRYPPPPFTTSLLQQDAINRFGFTSRMVMRLAQDLYERGLITYHRTDSFSLSTHFVFRAKDYIIEKFGEKYALEKPRGYKTRSRGAQEAHEAIRPTKLDRDVEGMVKEKKLTKNHKLLYDLIFNRALATQMKEADLKQIKIYIKSKKNYLFESTYQQVVFDGFLKVLNPKFVEKELIDPKIKKGDTVNLLNLEDEEKLTSPPPRYTEASLIKIMEEFGIGRPSTYSPIISLIQGKFYVDKEGRYFKPTNLGEVISDYLSSAFPEIFSTSFTAFMEEGLDKVAEGEMEVLTLLKSFYGPFNKELAEKKHDKQKIEFKEEDYGKCPKCGSPLTMRFSRFGKFYACTTYPKCKYTKAFLKTVQGKKCPKCSGNIVVRYSKSKKRFYGCENYPKCDFVAFAWKDL
ncbi:DNA topoisomerase I [Candidatus Roizmanbacteria bacterium RIFCSPLOWO2_12_FULL_40_12]|uniref:DNA topoisomerase 1 n=1 Tax=Candidatus Roizmanbacteria bacterium RIFCSPLOWO2_01_FULL_40_42 TaxID=1802066 RepID=A0A1F7J6Q0_9BACT|nr:MAG: DNA topoisomerase I [Candidatus Roizmanbacteria bacterium RIFCSPHIGHO2_01_FULL_40_98]OGK29177.1 MAG: DNA topoisomerase I [Candidatus Roizmanbacteria bacterium RIFCSPHIGHO2_02_FULL_40_53]OGK30696.1 MAG: DNA topoisomerase I [Candidatus Roizmanbacteria bacterium RIFCSPHIGHO2_12_41_18]OGK37213.1 MAG: DNA topoisomerase I [Candidatus Roizmanbacteria bacterium RIFCSPHIGHO2_12_FULL_40_130]OGK51287.1 MAG: DNA topoisomerase I [Candidatus Roizmanbacteria bacterium RIFCSPLOWO2_01_FULL_40_42]OGK587